LIQTRTYWRIGALVLLAVLATLEWSFLLVAAKLPSYAGPVKEGTLLPAFTATLADDSPIDEDWLKGGQNTILVFFRGRW
jgi:hypothetical protein